MQEGGDKGSGTKSSLLWNSVAIIEHVKPKYVIWENVKNVLSAKHKHNFEAYLEEMEKIGYKNYYQVLNAKDYGIPQNRERIFIVSILEDGKFDFPEKEELKNYPIDFLEDKVDDKYYLTESNKKTYNRDFGSKGKKIDLFKPIPTLVASMGTGGGNIPYFEFPEKQKLKLKLKDILETNPDEKYYLSERMVNYITADNEKWNGSMKSTINKTIASAINTSEGTRRCDASNYISNKLPENFDGKQIKNKESYKDYGIRKLTPKECWRLMGFSDEDFDKAKGTGMSDTQLYKQAGNSIVVNVLEAIFTNLFKKDNKENLEK